MAGLVDSNGNRLTNKQVSNLRLSSSQVTQLGRAIAMANKSGLSVSIDPANVSGGNRLAVQFRNSSNNVVVPSSQDFNNLSGTNQVIVTSSGTTIISPPSSNTQSGNLYSAYNISPGKATPLTTYSSPNPSQVGIPDNRIPISGRAATLTVPQTAPGAVSGLPNSAGPTAPSALSSVSGSPSSTTRAPLPLSATDRNSLAGVSQTAPTTRGLNVSNDVGLSNRERAYEQKDFIPSRVDGGVPVPIGNADPTAFPQKVDLPRSSTEEQTINGNVSAPPQTSTTPFDYQRFGEFGGTGPAFTGKPGSTKTGPKEFTERLPTTTKVGDTYLPPYVQPTTPEDAVGKRVNDRLTGPVTSRQSATQQGFVDDGTGGEFGGSPTTDPNDPINSNTSDRLGGENNAGDPATSAAQAADPNAAEEADPNAAEEADPNAAEEADPNAAEDQQNNNAASEDNKKPKPRKKKQSCSSGTPAAAAPAAAAAAQGLGAAAPAGMQNAMAAMAGAGMPAAIQSGLGGLLGGGGLGALQGLMKGGFGGILSGAIPQLGSLLGAAGPLGQVLSGGLLQQATGILGNLMGGGGAFNALTQIVGSGGLNNLLGSVMNPAQLLGQFANPQAILGLVSKQIPGLSLLANGFNGNAAGQLLGPILNQAAGGIFGQAFGKLGNSPIPGLNNLTQIGLNQILGLGNSKLPGLFGTTPANSIFGNDIITNIIGRVGGNAMKGTSLSGFNSALAIADAAAAQLNSIQILKNDAKYLKFTPKAQQFAAENDQNLKTSIGEISQSLGQEIIVPQQPAVIPLTGTLEETLANLLETDQVELFGSAYSNINDMITQGFGSLSSRPVLLGLDLLDLGEMGDIEDLFNIGNACQLARQIVLKGNISKLAIIDALTFNNLTVKDLTFSNNKNIIQTQILDKITDPATIQDALISLNIQNRQINKLGDLTNVEIMLPRSYIYNKFKNFEDMALTLALCGTGGFITTLSELGELMSQLETMEIGSPVYDIDDLGADLSGLDQLLEGIEPLNGEFFTIIDFLGSALGFAGFDSALYRISELQARVFSDPAASELYSLLEIMNDLLGGLYTDVGSGTITIPAMGTYTVLDDAVEAVRDRIEDEVDQIYLIIVNNVLGNDDSTIVIDDGSTVLESDLADSTLANYFELGDVLKELEDLYQYVIDFLEREKKLRKIAGIEFDEESIIIENFRADGSTSAFPLKKVPEDPETATVIVNRTVMLYGIDYTIETSGDSVLDETSLLVFTAPPDTLVTTLDGNNIIQVRYNVKGAIEIEDDPLGIANFIQTLEGYAVETGPYSIANILDKMSTPDEAGELIKSVMRQARNADLAETAFGIECKGLNRIGFDETSDNVFNYFDFIESYGFDQDSLNDSYIYQKTNFTPDQYYASRLNLIDSIDKTITKQQICSNVITQYLFVAEDDILVMSEEMYLAYELDLKNPGISRRVKLYKEIADSGYALGPVNDILYLMGQVEGSLAENPNYVVEQSTYDYLNESQLDLNRVVKVCQAQLISDISGIFNIHPSDTLLYFKRPSVVRSIQDYYNSAFIPPYNPIEGTDV